MSSVTGEDPTNSYVSQKFNGGWLTGAANHQYPTDPAKQVGSTDSDKSYISGLAAVGGKPFYMTAASPWFFTVCDSRRTIACW
jgi:hypothetical protein